jgi:soluble lytic murein transglycosylase
LARQLLRRRPGARIEHLAQRELLEALYWQEEDRDLLSVLEQRQRQQAPWDDELDLFRAVASHRLQIAEWRQLFVELFFDRGTSGLHARAYAYLEREGELSGFEPGVSLFFEGKDLLYRGQNAQAVEKIRNALRSLGMRRPDMEIVVRELGAAYFAVARHDEGARALLTISEDLSPSARLAALEMAGRLYRKGGSASRAEQLLLEVIRNTGEPEQRDRSLWFVLDMAAQDSTDRLIRGIEEFAPLWTEARYFNDLLERQVSSLVAHRDWSGLLSLYTALKGYGSPDIMARLAYLAGRSVSLGLVDASDIALSAQALYLEARGAGAATYYRFLAETALADLGFPVTWNLEESGGGMSAAASVDLEQPPSDVIRGYFDYGLDNRGAELLRAHWRSVSAELLFDAAVLLNTRGEFLPSIRLMNLYVLRSADVVARSDLQLLYPRAYRQWLEEVALSEDLPTPTFFALVREESYFDPRIVSRSGAVGLTQLMSETAADSARFLRMEQYDLRDPEQNLRLGGRHFSRLYSRLEDIPKALMAYNAGLTRLRRWERSFAGLPSDLLAEAAPYPETRNYVRKILVSAVYYAALYYEGSLEQTVLSFFPELGK